MKNTIFKNSSELDENSKLLEKKGILDSLKKENKIYLDEFNIIALDKMSIQFIDKYIRKRKLDEINKHK